MAATHTRFPEKLKISSVMSQPSLAMDRGTMRATTFRSSRTISAMSSQCSFRAAIQGDRALFSDLQQLIDSVGRSSAVDFDHSFTGRYVDAALFDSLAAPFDSVPTLRKTSPRSYALTCLPVASTLIVGLVLHEHQPMPRTYSWHGPIRSRRGARRVLLKPRWIAAAALVIFRVRTFRRQRTFVVEQNPVRRMCRSLR